jgi:hypothetical protein
MNVLHSVDVDTPEGTLEIKVIKSEIDGTVVIEVDTPDWEDGYDGPQLRLWLNDALLHHGVEILNHGLTTTYESVKLQSQ